MKKLLLSTLLLLLLPAAQGAPRILVLGDSLSAAHGMAQKEGWVSLLQQRLQREGYPHRVVNASISGETSSGALARLPRELDIHAPHIVLIELGGNDGLRGLSLETLEANLAAMIKMVLDRGAKPLLIGMRLPPNYGPTFTRRFAALFPALARRYDIPLVPFLLEGLATKRAFFQADGIHPNAAAQPLILDNVWSRLRELL